MKLGGIDMIDIGVVCGRFQIFHKEHLQYVLAAKKSANILLLVLHLQTVRRVN